MVDCEIKEEVEFDELVMLMISCSCMELSISVSRAQLRVLSAIFSNFVVGWLFAILGSRDSGRMALDLALSLVFWYLAVKTEEILEEL